MLQDVGKRIIEVRLARGWTQEHCAEQLHLDVRTLRRIEGGQHNMTVGTLVRIARRLGVSTQALFEPPVLQEPRRAGRPKAARSMPRAAAAEEGRSDAAGSEVERAGPLLPNRQKPQHGRSR